MGNKNWINYLKAKPITRWSLYRRNAKEQGRRATAHRLNNYQQRLHKQPCSSHSPGVCHICAQQPQLLPKAENERVHTLEKASHPLSSVNTEHAALWTEQRFCVVFKYISFQCDFFLQDLIYLSFSVNSCFMGPSKISVHSLVFIK